MSQEMNVLRCYSCKMFQVHIVKKARKWLCKLCNAKQSIQQIYFQGSGKDCRFHVQQLNYLKVNDTSFSLYPKQENSNDGCNTTSIVQETEVDKHVMNEWEKYPDSPKKESLSDAEDLSSDIIHEVEDIRYITNEKSLCNAINNDSCNFEDIVDDRNFGSEDVDDRNFGSEDIAEETEKLCSTSFNYNHRIEDNCILQDSGKSSKDHNEIANIFETYSELDDPIDI